MILRTVALEFRSKEPSPRWRSSWDVVFGAASAGLALLLGVAFGNVLSGVPLDADGNIQVSLIDLLTPFALLVGVTTVAMLAAHGSIYLVMKTEGELQARIERAVPRLLGGLLRPEHARRRRDGPVQAADHGALHDGHLAGDLPGRRAPGARRSVLFWCDEERCSGRSSAHRP